MLTHPSSINVHAGMLAKEAYHASEMQVCEKEMKIKAFSKEGLQAPQKDNPQERAKTEMRDKINGQVEQLETQV